MDDRYLVSMALCRAGFTGERWLGGCEVFEVDHPDGEGRRMYFNPLHDSADTLTLIVMAHTQILAVEDRVTAVCYRSQPPTKITEKYADHGGDKMAATRRAAVRAVAGF